ncbi:hypothetical protein [Clostridium beijerinckii]|uniref:Acyl carrier protein n=1 Tax=Clostridium beijerinckii TaxID=1520 RepID=A0AAE5LPU7_CLOBE|nr:hypothetical protein [Clostridium beijerinckii]ALB45657.1 acyl carrier protein [Clostridium beijerinckii NRRL B-598]NRT86805.1 acyl carrier protein [Clostridium beijerinckii]NSB14170.1 acyl carrier protein [Clostridium beijerinckii]NYC72236.1 acyl carrier protein [Clostridium beijerinckii]OOM30522.1 acyl carrier protein [Clostridium beijerinckii]
MNLSAEKIVKLTLINLDIEKEKLVEGAKIHGDLGLDSSEIVEVALALKNAFNFNVSLLTKASEDMTLGELYKLVEDTSTK